MTLLFFLEMGASTAKVLIYTVLLMTLQLNIWCICAGIQYLSQYCYLKINLINTVLSYFFCQTFKKVSCDILIKFSTMLKTRKWFNFRYML